MYVFTPLNFRRDQTHLMRLSFDFYNLSLLLGLELLYSTKIRSICGKGSHIVPEFWGAMIP